MSSSNMRLGAWARRFAALPVRLAALPKRLAAFALPVLLAGCFQPLYGTLGPGGLQNELAAIKVNPIADRIGHYMENELVFGFNGSRSEVPPRYRLVVILKERVQTPIIDTVTFRTTSATLITDAQFELVPIGGGPAVYKSTAFAVASYDRFSQRISNVRAARDAEVRDARVLAESIREQVAAFFASRGS